MHGQKKKKKRALEATTTIDGFELCWQLVSEPQRIADEYRGLCISVQTAKGAHRTLILQYPYPHKRYSNGVVAPVFSPVRPQISLKEVDADIRRAMAAGWKPMSRGRDFTFQVPDTAGPRFS